MTATLAYRVTMWSTHQKPYVREAYGHDLGVQAPGELRLVTGLTVSALRAEGARGVGIVDNLVQRHRAV
ncbi:MAG: hypothetical protein ACRDO1_06105 [Nocardioidaceae bacterium]